MDNPNSEPVVAPVEATPDVVETPQEAPIAPVEAPVETTVEPVAEEVAEPVEKPTKDVDNKLNEQLHQFVIDAGIDVKDMATTLGKDGVLSPEMMRKLVDKHGEGVAALVSDQLKSKMNEQKTANDKRDQDVYVRLEEEFKGVTEQSGKETWQELATWAKTNVDNTERKELNGLLQQGGLAAKLAISELVSKFKSMNNTQDAQLLEADSASSNPVGSMDKASYDRELRKLLNEGHNYDNSPQIASLNNQRSRAITRGI